MNSRKEDDYDWQILVNGKPFDRNIQDAVLSSLEEELCKEDECGINFFNHTHVNDNNESREQDVKRNDPVNSPSHYTGHNGIECIDAMESAFGTQTVIDFCIGNAFKYIWRHRDKNNPIEDLYKAKWYITKAQELAKKF